MKDFKPQVMLNFNAEPLIVFGRGRVNYHAIIADRTVRLLDFPTLQHLRAAEWHGKPYPVKRAASFYLNHSTREITKRAKLILRLLVKRAIRQEAVA